MPFPICFDIDDTLVVGTSYRFRRAVLECSLIILDALAPEPVSPTRLLQLQHEYDLALMPRYGFTRPRFCRSVTETYRAVVQSRGRPADPRVLQRLYRVAGNAYRPPYQCAPGAHLVLEQLRAHGHPLSVVTIGPRSTQERKLRLTGLDQYFGQTVFTRSAEEKQAAIGRLLCGSSSGRGVMVGDSLHHDVRAALAVGVTAVWVRTPDLWAVFDAQLDPQTFHTIDYLRELLPFVEALDHT